MLYANCTALNTVAATATTVDIAATLPSICFTSPFLPYASPPSHLLLTELLLLLQLRKLPLPPHCGSSAIFFSELSLIHLATATPSPWPLAAGAKEGFNSFHAAIHVNIPSPNFSK